MRRSHLTTLIVIGVLGIAACAPAPQNVPASGAAGQPGTPRESRTLVLVIRNQPETLASTTFVAAITTTGTQKRIFNAGLALQDGDAQIRPYLAEALPTLNTESWRVSPDGRMETMYRLRPNLTWHDGSALSTEDFVFAWRVYATPDFGISGQEPQSLVEEITAPDQRSLVIRWARPFPNAAMLGEAELAPLPRHILSAPYQNEREGFLNLPYWTMEYVGAGPYRVDRWEPGAFVEAAAFPGHALGRPKIERIRFIFNADFNATLASMLAGAVHMPVDDSIRFQQALILKREWDGTVEFRSTLWRFVQIQLRPEYAHPRAMLDLRVRKALAHTVDKGAINEGMFEGQGIMSDSLIYSTVDYFPALDRAVAKYPYDPRRAEQLMAEAGFAKDRDGFYTSPPEGRVSFELRVIASAHNEAERAIMADIWRRNGFEIEEALLSPAQVGSGQVRGTYRSMETTGGSAHEPALVNYTSARISRPENRWIGINRGGWINQEYDRLIEAFLTTLDRRERNQLVVQAVKVLTEELPMLSLYFNPYVQAVPAGLRGVNARAAGTEVTWNIHEWEFS
jgi:peptide/nickel transport system substrate-binding protein